MTLISFCCRLELLEDAPDNSGLLLLLLNTTDMLACCCEGTNPFIESICQTIFSVEELLEVGGEWVEVDGDWVEVHWGVGEGVWENGWCVGEWVVCWGVGGGVLGSGWRCVCVCVCVCVGMLGS